MHHCKEKSFRLIRKGGMNEMHPLVECLINVRWLLSSMQLQSYDVIEYAEWIKRPQNMILFGRCRRTNRFYNIPQRSANRSGHLVNLRCMFCLMQSYTTQKSKAWNFYSPLSTIHSLLWNINFVMSRTFCSIGRQKQFYLHLFFLVFIATLCMFPTAPIT